jgi:hypothetical protein
MKSDPMRGSDRGQAAFTMLFDSKAFQERYRGRDPQLRVLRGGWNLQTRFSHFGVRSGDTIFAVSVAQKRLHLFGRMTVDELEVEEGFETARGVHGSRVYFDLTVPREILERWRFSAKRGERSIKFLIDGEITRAISFHGIYRLTSQTSSDLFGLLLDHEAKRELSR